MKILNDFNTSVVKALNEIDENWADYPGLIVCGTHNPGDPVVILNKIKVARQEGTPFLGICFGMQMMAVEYVKNVVGIKEATSQELGEGQHVVKKMPGLRVGLQPAMVKMKVSEESFWHQYRVDVDKFPQLWDGFEINEANEVVTWMKLKDRNNFFGVQFHPEYQSSKDKPHPVLVEFINKCKGYEKVSGSSTPISDMFKKHGK